ncbi:chromatin accessibility complex protein 1 [Topomyia yanbarensis]|uniref:chromatin accessibility complex protein 1 n=1 Tax=Topomyia yanbarensis TaxID=2498891 RepID=UPI00273C09E6|nr:chromatin accessibility complex protein 1 [Topomyia yanbarensis]
MDHEKHTQLPISRIRTVMKTSPSIGQINPDALFLMCRAAELFIEHVAKNSYKKGMKNLDYKHLAAYVESEEALEFLVQILPKKITVKEYKKIMEQKNKKGTSEGDGDSEGESGEESDDEDSNDSSSSSSASDEEDNADNGSVISIDSSSSDEKENSKNISNKKSPLKHKTGDSP